MSRASSQSKAEPVKHVETRSSDAFSVTSSLGSLIHATVGSSGGSGRRQWNLVGLAAEAAARVAARWVRTSPAVP